LRELLISIATLAACSPPPPPVPHNVAPPAQRVHVAATDSLGWLALAPTPKRNDKAPSWLPVDDHHPLLIPGAAEGLLPGAVLTAIATRGGPTRAVAGAPTSIHYGCDQNQLDIVPLTGDHLAPGVVWLLHTSVPSTWSPAPLDIASSRATATERHYTVGPLGFDLQRRDDTHGTLAITHEGRTVHTAPFERGEMEGADASPLDLSGEGPGIPAPVAAWSIAPGGPFLVVVVQPGYEGVTLSPWLIDDEAARPIEAMSLYLYSCAF
jgi:hypothetical protein